jgi:hypothetical protein
MDESEWERLNTVERGQALQLAGTPESTECDSYEPLGWDSLPRHVRAALTQLPANWQQPSSGPVH